MHCCGCVFRAAVFRHDLFKLKGNVLVGRSKGKGLGAVQVHVPVSGFNNLFVPITPANRRRHVTSFLSTGYTRVSILAASVRARVSALRRCGQSIVARAIAGKLGPSTRVGSDKVR